MNVTSTPALTTSVETTISESSMNENGSCSMREFDVISLTIQLLISFIIIVPNAAVVKVIFTSKDRSYQRPAYSFIASLCIADMLVAVYVIISVISDVAGLELSPRMWAVMYTCGSVPFYASVLHLLVIAIDRLLYIGYFTRYRYIMTKKAVLFLISFCWILSFLPVIPIASGFGACGDLCDCPNDGILLCKEFSCSSIFAVFKKTFLFGNVFLFLFVMVLISVMYSILFYKVREQSKKAFSHSNTKSKQSKRMRKEYNLARTLAIVILVFFACWGPLIITYVVDFSLPYDQRIGEVAANIISIPNLINSISNPIIYAARMKRMRKEMLPCLKTSTRSNSYHISKEGTTKKTRHSFKQHGKKSDASSSSFDVVT